RDSQLARCAFASETLRAEDGEEAGDDFEQVAKAENVEPLAGEASPADELQKRVELVDEAENDRGDRSVPHSGTRNFHGETPWRPAWPAVGTSRCSRRLLRDATNPALLEVDQ